MVVGMSSGSANHDVAMAPWLDGKQWASTGCARAARDFSKASLRAA